jgi:hypothetical protein
VPQQVGDPLAVLDVGLPAGHGLDDVKRVPFLEGESVAP